MRSVSALRWNAREALRSMSDQSCLCPVAAEVKYPAARHNASLMREPLAWDGILASGASNIVIKELQLK